MMPADPAPSDRRRRDQASGDLAIRLSLLGVFAYFALSLVQPFLPIMIWSAVLAVALYPIFAWLRDRVRLPSWLAATLVTSGALGVLLGPATLLIASLIRSLEALSREVGSGAPRLPPPPASVADLPLIGPFVSTTWTQASGNLEDFLARYGKAMLGAGEWLLHAVAGLAGSVLIILIAVTVAGFLYGPGPRLATGVRHFADRIAGPRGSGFVDLAAATIRSVARGVIGVATIQALLVGVGLLVAGVPASGLLTLAVLVLAILQIGGGPVMLPVLIWAWLNMDTGPALLLTLYMIPVGLIDNVLKPLLMGKGLATPFLVILAGVIGGTVTYGLVGLFVGPIVLAVFYDLLMVWTVTPPPADDPPRPASG